MEFTQRLTFNRAFRFLNCTVESHYSIEGEMILAADHLILIGFKDRTNETAETVALCVQTSGLTAEPQQIILKIRDICSEPDIVEGECLCAAGLSERCKRLRVNYPLLQVSCSVGCPEREPSARPEGCNCFSYVLRHNKDIFDARAWPEFL